MTRRVPTAEITLGPFFPRAFAADAGANDLTSIEGRQAAGERIEIHGRVTQEDGAPLHNLVIEIWQADASGVFPDPADPRGALADPGFFGWGRAATDRDGVYRFRTIRPGGHALAAGRRRAPHVNLLIVFSGLSRQLQTTLFFPDETANHEDPVLLAVPPARRDRLIAAREAGEPVRYRFDIRLRGAGETPFFDD